MARGRFLNKTVSTDGKVANLMALAGPYACLFHHRIIAFLDCNGNVRADSFWLKATVFPRDSDVFPEDCRNFVGSLSESGLARVFSVDGNLFLNFPNFAKNQVGLRPEKEKPECPLFDESLEVHINQLEGYLSESSRKNSDSLPENFRPNSDRSERVSGSESEIEVEVELLSVSPSEPAKIDLTNWMSDIVTQWNQMANELGYTKIRGLTPDRRLHLKARNKEPAFNFPEIMEAFRKFKPKSYGNGSWKPDFNFITRNEAGYVRILEGEFATNGKSNGKIADSDLGPPGQAW